MRIPPNKTFPHPVLGREADYCRRAFQVIREFSLDENDAPTLSFQFSLNDDGIEQLVADKRAKYVIEIHCPTTFVRRAFSSDKQDGKVVLSPGELHKRVEVNAFIVSTATVNNYSSPNFNPEFGDNVAFKLLPGDVIAVASTDIYYWDTELTAPLGSVFQLENNKSVKKGTAQIDTSGDFVKIYMHPDDLTRFQHMRKSKEQRPVAMLVYFSSVAEVLNQMRVDGNGGGQDTKWYRAIEYKLQEMGKDITSASEDPFLLAQELLRRPLQQVLPQLD